MGNGYGIWAKRKHGVHLLLSTGISDLPLCLAQTWHLLPEKKAEATGCRSEHPVAQGPQATAGAAASGEERSRYLAVLGCWDLVCDCAGT